MSAANASSPNAAQESTPGSNIPYERFLDCVHCGLCTAACPTYLETGDENNSPRGRIYLMRAVTDGRLQLTDDVSRSLDLCLDCRSCESACPSGVRYGRLIEPFRIAMKRRRDATRGVGWFERTVLHGLFPSRNRLRWALAPARWMQRLKVDRLAEATGLVGWLPEPLRRMHRLLPPLEPNLPALPSVLTATGPKRATVALFLGCVGDAMFRRVHWATARVLQANGCEVHVPAGQDCCGAIHYHSGSDRPALKLASANASAFTAKHDAKYDAVIVNIAGCGAMLKEYWHLAEELAPGDHSVRASLEHLAGQVRDVSEFLAALGPIKPAGSLPMKVAYHDACHLAHAQQIREQPRSLLNLIDGLELVPLTESEVCCGAAGSYNLTEGDMADRLARRKIEHLKSTGADVVAMGNAGCSLQIQAELRRAGLTMKVYHPIELLDAAYRQTKLDS